LERLRGRVSTQRIAHYYPSSPYFARAPVHVFFTAVFERQVWRYPYARAYRAALAEAGHVCQTFCLSATWLGLAPFCLMGLADSLIEGDLGIDGVGESVLYAAGLGLPPKGVAWAPLAPNTKGTLKTRPNRRIG
jgi:SagB-type dehydrogenase family enzyme